MASMNKMLPIILLFLVGGGAGYLAFFYEGSNSVVNMICSKHADQQGYSEFGYVIEYKNAEGDIEGYEYEFRIPDGGGSVYDKSGALIGGFGGFPPTSDEGVGQALDKLEQLPVKKEFSCGA
jgi:hypothetical protein